MLFMASTMVPLFESLSGHPMKTMPAIDASRGLFWVSSYEWARRSI